MTLTDLALDPDQLRNLYLIHLQQMHSAEEQLLLAVPTIAINISMPEMRYLLLMEAGSTPDHLSVLRTIYTALGETPPAEPICMPVKALVDLSDELLTQHPFGSWRDLLLVALALELKHLNIAKYVMAQTFANALNFERQAMVLSQVVSDETEIERQLRFLLQNLPLTTPAP